MTSSILPLRFAPMLALSLALVTAPAAHARNESLKQPIDKALADKGVQEIAARLPLRFGGASANGIELIPGDVEAQGAASIVSEDTHRRDHLTDEEMCVLAFQKAIAQLSDAARGAGAVAVVGIVSDYKGNVVDDPDRYDCHAGSTKSWVMLRGKLARTYVAGHASPAAQPAPVPAAPVEAKGEHE